MKRNPGRYGWGIFRIAAASLLLALSAVGPISGYETTESSHIAKGVLLGVDSQEPLWGIPVVVLGGQTFEDPDLRRETLDSIVAGLWPWGEAGDYTDAQGNFTAYFYGGRPRPSSGSCGWCRTGQPCQPLVLTRVYVYAKVTDEWLEVEVPLDADDQVEVDGGMRVINLPPIYVSEDALELG